MKLKKWPYWLRGGILAVVLTVAVSIILDAFTGKPLSPQRFMLFLPDLGADFLMPLLCPSKENWGEWGSLTCIPVQLKTLAVLFFVQFFIFGAFLGWLYGNLKNRKQLTP